MNIENLGFAILTGSTCGSMCWEAREEVCRCSCGGANHGILNHGGERPNRTSKINGNFYELIAIIPGKAEGECWNDAFDRERNEVSRIMDERFPDIDRWAYGNWGREKTMPVVCRKISASQSKWDEVKTIPNAYSLVWARPEGSCYLVRCEKTYINGMPEYSKYNDVIL